MTTPPTPLTVGIDIGSETTKVVLGSLFSCEIVRTDAGMHTTPTAVSFPTVGKLRQVGETASQKGKNAILHINRLLTTTSSSSTDANFMEEFYSFQFQKANDNTVEVEVDYDGQPRSFSAAAILAMLLSNIQKNALATIHRLQPDTDTSATPVHYLFTVQPGTDASVHSQLLDAAHAAGIEGKHVQIVESSTAYAATYQRKFPDSTSDSKTTLIVDMGHTQTSVAVVKFGTTTTPTDDEQEPEPTMEILAAKSDNALGAASVDKRLWYHFQSTMPALKNVTPKSRAGLRLLQGSHKLKHLLSQLPDGKVTVENVGDNDTDVSLHATRATLAELCEPDAKTLQQLIQSTLAEAKLEPSAIDTVEVLGGGCRIPWVQATIQDLLPSKTLSKSLDDTSAALGAALVGEKPAEVAAAQGLIVVTPEPTDADVERRNQLRQAEIVMAAMDLDEQVKSDLRNKMESQILELRSAKHGKHGALLPSDNSLEDYLTVMDDWLFSEECDQANREAMEAKQTEMQAKTQELCAGYYTALEEEQKAKEKEMEDAAKQAQLENNGGDGGGDEEDHDNRRLPKKRRMEIVMKNKQEANELFKDGNWKFAAARYTKALTHCAKFVDLAPDDIKEVTDLKVTLNLNLALAYTKMSNYDQCLRVCNEAIALDEASAKAYYRRAATFYEKKKWDEAKSDVVKAKQLAEGDKAIAKLGDRIELQLKKQKQKEKKMASKMFG